MPVTAKPTTTVRISEASHRRLRELADQSGQPMQIVLDKAIERYRREQFWRELDAAYAAIQSDPEALSAEKAEQALWDKTLMDGLDPNEKWTDDDFVTVKDDNCG